MRDSAIAASSSLGSDLTTLITGSIRFSVRYSDSSCRYWSNSSWPTPVRRLFRSSFFFLTQTIDFIHKNLGIGAIYLLHVSINETLILRVHSCHESKNHFTLGKRYYCGLFRSSNFGTFFVVPFVLQIIANSPFY